MSGAEEAKPPRPHLPPVLLAGLALWATAAALWPAARTFGEPALLMLVVGSLAGAGALVLGCLRRRAVPPVLVVLLAVMVGAASVALAAGALQNAMGALVGSEGPWRCTLTTDAKPSDFGWRADARAVDPLGRSVAVRLYLPDEGAGLLRGTTLSVEAPLEAPGEANRERWWNDGLAGSLSASEVSPVADAAPLRGLRSRAIEVIERHGGGQSGLLQALICGYRPTIEQSGRYEQFKTTGLAHLVAVSGAHLSIVTLFVAQGLKLLRLGRRSTAVATGLFLAGYVVFTGMPVSALRAAVMAVAGLMALVTDRRSSALNALGACILLFTGIDPSCALTASFVLSAGSTLGIVLLTPLFATVASSWPRVLRRLVADPLALTMASAAATQPYAAALFSQLPLLSPVANVLATPLFTVGCVVGFVAVLAACALPAVAPAAVACAAAAVSPLDGVVGLLAAVPRSCLPVDAEVFPMLALSVVLVGALWAWWPTVRPKAAGGALAALLALGAAPAFALSPPGDEIVMLDVGQGDAFLVRSQGSSLLIDTGNQDGLLKEACARQGVRALDRVAVSHPDDDHCGSLEALGDVAAVGGLLVADDLLACPCAACDDLRDVAEGEAYPQGIQGLAVGDRLRCGRFTLEVLWPEAFRDEGGNGDSLSFLCSYDGDGDGTAEWTALFCGDAESEELRAMADRLPPDGVDVLKVGHHGSKKSLDAELAARLAPSVALVGVGESNRYGHPAPVVLDALEAAGARVLCSDEAGDVTVGFSVEKLTVRTQRNGEAAGSGTMGP